MTRDSKPLTGGCLCGQVSIRIDGLPQIANNCHCLSCQKLTGTGHAPLMIFARSAVRIEGETKGYAWTADSGNTVTTHFCPECGSPLHGLSTGFPGMVILRAGTLDESDDIAPQFQVYTKRLRSWDRLIDGLPSFEALPPHAPA